MNGLYRRVFSAGYRSSFVQYITKVTANELFLEDRLAVKATASPFRRIETLPLWDGFCSQDIGESPCPPRGIGRSIFLIEINPLANVCM